MSRNSCHMSCITCHVSCVMCHILCVMCHMSRVSCHLSLAPTGTATDPHPANSPIMHSRLVCKDHKTKQKYQKAKNHWNNKTPKMCRGIPILAIWSSTRSHRPTGKRVFPYGTDRHSEDSRTSQLRDWIGPVGCEKSTTILFGSTTVDIECSIFKSLAQACC